MHHPGLAEFHRARLHIGVLLCALGLWACGSHSTGGGQSDADASSTAGEGGHTGSGASDAGSSDGSLDAGIDNADDAGADGGSDAGGGSAADGGAPTVGPFCPPNTGVLLPTPAACWDAECMRAACTNGAQDQGETGVDCGGLCAPCAMGEHCYAAEDCATGVCAPPYCAERNTSECAPRQCTQKPAAAQALALYVGAIARNPVDGTVFASVSAYEGMVGAVLAFAPGSTSPSYAIGLPSPGGPLAVTDDGSALYVGVTGDNPGVIRIDVATRDAAAPFALGTSKGGRVVYPAALATVPGRPDLIGVVGGETGLSGGRVGVHVYKDGAALFDAKNLAWQTNAAYNSMSVSAAVFTSASRLYAMNGANTAFDFATVDLTPSGLRITSVRNDIVPGFKLQPSLAGGKLFMNGRIVAPEEPRVLGALRGVGPMAVNASGTRAYMTVVGDGGPLTIACFDTKTFTRSGLVALDLPVPEDASSLAIEELAIWGDDGLILRTAQKLVLAKGALTAQGCGPLDAPTPDPALLSEPDAQDEWTQTYCLSVADTAYAPRSKVLYATVSQKDERYANRLAAIRVDGSGFASAPWVGSEPGQLALSSDESTAWLAPRESRTLVSVDLSADGPVSTYATAIASPGYALRVRNLSILSGTSDSVAVTGDTGFTSSKRVNIYDRGVARFAAEPEPSGIGALHAGYVVAADASQLFVTGGGSLASVRVGPDALSIDWQLPEAKYSITHAQGKLLDEASLLVDTTERRLVGGLPQEYDSQPTLLAQNGLHAYRARYAPSSPVGKTRIEVQCFDLRTFTPSGSLTIDVPDPNRCAISGPIQLGMLDDWGLFMQTGGAVVVAPNALACVPGCTPDAAPPLPVLPPTPDAQDTPAAVFAYADLQVGDLRAHAGSGTLFASIRDTDKRLPNTVLAFSGGTGALNYAVQVGSDPQPLTVSNDGSKLYVGLNKAARIVSVDLGSRAVLPWLIFDPIADFGGRLRYPVPVDLEPLPGASEALAISAAPLDQGVGLGAWKYESGALTSIANLGMGTVSSIAVIDAHTFWIAGSSVHKVTVASNGEPTTAPGLSLPLQVRQLTLIGNGNVVTNTGAVFHGQTGATLGQLPVEGAIAVRTSASKILVASRTGQGGFSLSCFDASTLQQTGQTTLTIPENFDAGYGQPTELELLGAQGVALSTAYASLLLYPQALSGVPGC